MVLGYTYTVEILNVVSKTQEFSNDLTTPMSAYLKLSAPYTFLLESVEQGAAVGRYSMIGIDPIIKVQGYTNYMALITTNENTVIDGDPLKKLDALYRHIYHQHTGGTPIKNGFFGYFTWEIIEKIEAINLKKNDGLLYEFQWPSVLIIFDHVSQSIHITASQLGPFDATEKINQVLEKIRRPLPATQHINVISPMDMDWNLVKTNWGKSEFMTAVETIQHHIKEGDIFQGVLSQKLFITSNQDSLSVYRALRHINPSPYMFYFNYGEYKVIGSSPEMLVRARQGKATVRPIAGTRKREYGREDDLIEDLKNDEKEVAEHIMLVDLGRNDLGRICNINTIDVSDMMSIEMYSHVIHMVTNVTGELLRGATPVDILRAVFPAGTLSGAPKIKAIQIIDSVEPYPRHLYGGAIGYFNTDGDVDFCIAIRTLVSRVPGQYELQVGAGIVNDSIPENEYNETLNKAQGVLMACLDRS
jgi:anthranilate synthase component 1